MERSLRFIFCVKLKTVFFGHKAAVCGDNWWVDEKTFKRLVQMTKELLGGLAKRDLVMQSHFRSLHMR